MSELNELNKLMENFLSYLKSKKKSENTIKGYKHDLIPFVEYFNSLNMNITDIKLKHLEKFLATINCKESSMNRKISAIQSFFKYLKKVEEVIETNHAIDIERPKIPERQVIYLQLDESKKMLNNIKGENKERDLAILTVFLHCGLRLSELVSININTVTENTFNVIGKGNKERPVLLDNECVRVIEEYIKVRPNIENEKALFLSEQKQRISTSAVQKVVKKHIKKSNLDTKKYSTHKLRSTCATLLSQNNVPIEQIQELLGHSNISTTRRYVGVDKKQLMNAVNSNPLND
jgi:integrase/recombinase XerD